MFEIPSHNKAPFRDREDAGRQLYANFPLDFKPDQILAIPRGGLPVAYEMAVGFNVPMDILAAKKLNVPRTPEAGFGAVSYDGTSVLNEEIINRAQITTTEVRIVLEQAEREAKRLMWFYRKDLPSLALENKNIIITDDGLATGHTMLAAVLSARRMKANNVSVVVPCVHDDALRLVGQQADNIFALHQSSEKPFAIADYYQYWRDLTDEEAARYLNRSRERKII